MGNYCPVVLCLTLFFTEVEAQSGAWTRKADLPTHRLGVTASVVDGRIYVLGGMGVGLVEYAVNEAYDPLTDTWEGRTSFSAPRAWPASAVVNDTIYCIGGGYPTARQSLEAYDPATNTWRTQAPMPTARFGGQAVAVNGVVYTIGGYSDLRTCEAYDPATNTWIPKTPRPERGGVLAATAYDGIIYTFGGGSLESWPASAIVYAYNPQTDSWSRKTDMPTARFGLQASLVGGKIYAIGGCNTPDVSLATVEVYDPVHDTWEKKADMPKAFAFHAGAVVDDKIYVIAGSPQGMTDGFEVWEYDPNATLRVMPQAVDFGSVEVGQSSDTMEVEITNVGLDPVTVNSVTLDGTAFSLSNLPPLPAALAPSDSFVFGVSFHPTTHGNAGALVLVMTSGTLRPTVSIGLEGSGLLYGPELGQLVDRVTSASYPDRPALVDSFFAKHPVTPLIERDSICQFLYRGTPATVSVSGDVNQWTPVGSAMTRLSTTDLWIYVDVFEPDARLAYKFIEDGINWILDPRNPLTCLGDYGPNSEVAMPSYVRAPELRYYPDIPHGALHDTTFHSDVLGNTRTVRIYTPPMYVEGVSDSFEVAVLHDGLAWISWGGANNALDYLIHHGRVRPLIAVFVPPVNREAEYVGAQQDQFAAFISTELMPYVDARYRTQRRLTSRASIGISHGGNIALWIMHLYPREFGNAASYSGSVYAPTSSAFDIVPAQPQRLYVDAGTYDLAGYLDLSKNFCQILQSRGYAYRWREWHEAHSWGSWSTHLDEALEFFFPGTAVGVQEEQGSPRAFALAQNYPNPFNPSTTIRFELPVSSDVRLGVYDVLGREVSALVNERRDAGVHEVKFDGSGLSSGVYFYRLWVRPLDSAIGRDSKSGAGEFVQTRKLVLLQ